MGVLKKRKSSIIALLTDFGYLDAYVGIMKGVILSIAPNVQIVDISHSVMPQQIDQSAYLLWTAYKWFPPGTIFVCVVDPGVGTQRKILCVATEKHYFIAPDNGVLKYILASSKVVEIVEVKNVKFALKDISSTFHGRDIFAPIAAHLCLGTDIYEFGTVAVPQFGAENFVEIIPHQTMSFRGRIIHIDRFGNIVTNFLLSSEKPAKLSLQVGQTIVNHFYQTYASAPPNKPFLIKGSTNLLEVSVRNGNAANLLRTNVNQKLHLRVVENEP